MDKDKIVIIINLKSEESKNKLQDLGNILKCNYYDLYYVFLNNISNTAQAYNLALKHLKEKQIKAKYKIYIRDDLLSIDINIVNNLVYMASTCYGEFMLGYLGSYMPCDGDYIKTHELYGKYNYVQAKDNKIININDSSSPLYKQKVHILDSAFFMTSVDFLWDDEVGEEFYMAAQCSKFRESGIDMYVIDDAFSIPPLMGRVSDFHQDPDGSYLLGLSKFKKKYKDIIQPLVSIGIPTYNNKAYLKESLDSALKQDYGNIEIIIGDDSTNEDIKKMIEKEYLDQYSNITYIYHGGPLGGRGEKNCIKILNCMKGDYYQLLFHDDIIYPHKISTMMDFFLRDIDERIGFVASKRNIINEKGDITIPAITYSNKKYTIIDGHRFGRSVLESYQNYVGEHSTVLLRRDTMHIDENMLAEIGYCWEIKDSTMSDISMWLDISRQRDFIYIEEPLSSFRRGNDPEQNTNNIDIYINSIMMWLSFAVLAWLNDDFIIDQKHFEFICFKWYSICNVNEHNHKFKSVLNDTSAPFERKHTVDILLECGRFIANGEYDNMLNRVVSYLIYKHGSKKEILDKCFMNKVTGMWQKR